MSTESPQHLGIESFQDLDHVKRAHAFLKDVTPKERIFGLITSVMDITREEFTIDSFIDEEGVTTLEEVDEAQRVLRYSCTAEVLLNGRESIFERNLTLALDLLDEIAQRYGGKRELQTFDTKDEKIYAMVNKIDRSSDRLTSFEIVYRFQNDTPAN